ncbi:hypothetical protein LMG1861_01624 [Achromobacter piechaudii]|uniref:Uncharacterized protein n=1 Tax=Achromobacter piechaudii TaxID=72556 RepID=A0A6S7CQH0_9BURK|nr:hypothetical protein LMG1861_01624 [Achromobacter piechaudii]
MMPALPLVIARTPKSVSVSSRTSITAPGFEMIFDSLTKVSRGFLVSVFISVPFRDKVANGLGASTNNFYHVVAFEESAVT